MSQYSWTTQRTVDLGTGRVSHSFMVIPECPYPLLGRDLLTKIGAQITFRQGGGAQVTDGKGHPIQVLTMKLEDEYRLHQEALPSEDNIDRWLQEFPSVWAETGGMGLAAHRTPVLVELKPGESPVRIKQYPMSQEARKGIQPHIRRLRSLGVLVPCQSAWNTPLLPVKKPHTNDYRPVQDLREVNKRVTDIHPTVPNPYTLLSSLAPSRVWYTVLDLKDAFFSLPLAPQSQPLFVFKWHDPEEGYSGQLTWTQLPQGFKNSPTIFDEALHEDLEGARGHLATPPCHLRGWPDPDTSSVQAGRLGLCQEAPLRDPRAALERTLHRGADNPHCSQSRWHRDLGPSHPCSVSRSLLDPEGLRHAMGHQSGPTQPAQAQATAHSTHLILVILLTLLVIAHAAGSPHAPQSITWQIIDTSSGTILNQTSQSHPRDACFPELRVNLQTLFLSP
uniref:Peptidase A2 domain-containing protein n=1 Tax=Felis catus TaxID=9685 RepID=A0ABI7X6G1_FELCA